MSNLQEEKGMFTPERIQQMATSLEIPNDEKTQLHIRRALVIASHSDPSCNSLAGVKKLGEEYMQSLEALIRIRSTHNQGYTSSKTALLTHIRKFANPNSSIVVSLGVTYPQPLAQATTPFWQLEIVPPTTNPTPSTGASTDEGAANSQSRTFNPGGSPG